MRYAKTNRDNKEESTIASQPDDWLGSVVLAFGVAAYHAFL